MLPKRQKLRQKQRKESKLDSQSGEETKRELLMFSSSETINFSVIVFIGSFYVISIHILFN